MQRMSPKDDSVQTRVCIVNELHRFAHHIGKFRPKRTTDISIQSTIAKVVNSVHRSA